MVVSVAFAGFAVVATATFGAIVVSDAFDAIVVSVAADFLVAVVDLILILVHVRFPLTVLHTSLVFAFAVVAAVADPVPSEPTPNERVKRSAEAAAKRRRVDRSEVIFERYGRRLACLG